MPDLAPGLAQEALRAPAVGRLQGPVEQAAGGVRGEVAVLRGDASGQHPVDPLVVTPAAVDDAGLGEVVVGDHREQRLRQVVVDVGVDPEQHLDQR